MRSTFYISALLLWCVAAGAANLVPDSSFELNGARGWAVQKSATANESQFQMSVFISTEAQHGGRSFQLFPYYVLMTRGTWLVPGHTHYLTYYAKGSASFTFSQYQTNLSQTGRFTDEAYDYPQSVTTSWQRYTNTFAWNGQNEPWFIAWQVTSGNTLYIDSVQIETNSPTAYAPMAQVECGMQTTNFANVFYAGQAHNLDLRYWNNGSSVTNVTLWESYDLWNRQVGSGYVTNVLLANNRFTNKINFPMTNGWQRIVTRLTDYSQAGNDSRDEMTIASLVTAPDALAANTNGMFGILPDSDHVAQQNALRPIGFTWLRTSAQPGFRWNDIEPTEGAAYVWPDAAVARMCTNTITPVFCLMANDAVAPDWAWDASGNFRTNVFAGFCSNVVTKYSAPPYNIKWWEVWNEPHTWCDNSGPPYTTSNVWFCVTNNYANLLASAARAIKTVDPDAKIVGFGGYRNSDPEWALRAYQSLSATDKANIDAVSYHIYPKSTADNPMGSETDPYPALWNSTWAGIEPIWNTESGHYERDGYLTDVVQFNYSLSDGYQPIEWQRALEPTESAIGCERLAQVIARCIGNGGAKYFYYSSIGFDANSFFHANSEGSHPTIWSHNATLRPKAVVMAIMRAMIDESINRKLIANAGNANLEMYYFGKGASNIVIAWNSLRSITDMTVTNESYNVYDLMGNRVAQAAGKIRITRVPQYVVSTTLNSNQLCQTLCFASVSDQGDTTGPYVTVDWAPSGSWVGGTYPNIKWTALDDVWRISSVGITNVDYAWKIDSGTYSVFSQTNLLRNLSMTATNHTLWVKARDGSGNVTEISYVFDPIGSAPPEEPPPDPPPGGFAQRNGRTRFPLGGFP